MNVASVNSIVLLRVSGTKNAYTKLLEIRGVTVSFSSHNIPIQKNSFIHRPVNYNQPHNSNSRRQFQFCQELNRTAIGFVHPLSISHEGNKNKVPQMVGPHNPSSLRKQNISHDSLLIFQIIVNG